VPRGGCRAAVPCRAALRSGHVDPGWTPALQAAAPALLGLLGDDDPAVRRAAIYLAGAGGIGASRAEYPPSRSVKGQDGGSG